MLSILEKFGPFGFYFFAYLEADTLSLRLKFFYLSVFLKDLFVFRGVPDKQLFTLFFCFIDPLFEIADSPLEIRLIFQILAPEVLNCFIVRNDR